MKQFFNKFIVILISSSLLSTTIFIPGTHANIATAKDRMEELAPQMADARCDIAYDNIYRFGEILYRIRVNFRQAEELEGLLVITQIEQDRFGEALQHFDNAVAQLQTAYVLTESTLEPFEIAIADDGRLSFRDEGTVSTHSQGLLTANRAIIAALTKVKNEAIALSSFFVDDPLVLFDEYIFTYSEIMRLSFASLVRGLDILLAQAKGIDQDTALHLRTLRLFLEVNRIWRRIEIYLNNFLPANRVYAQELYDLLDGTFSRIASTQSNINQEADELVEEAEELYENTVSICHQTLRADTYVPYDIDPVILRRLLKDAEKISPVKKRGWFNWGG